MFDTVALFYAFFRRLAIRRWRLLLLIGILCAIPVLIVQFVMLQEEQSSYFDFWNRQDPNSRLAVQLLDDRPLIKNGAVNDRNAEPFWQRFRNVTFPPELSRSLQYCNRLVPKGEEGKVMLSDKWQMTSLFVIIRHGARTSLRISPLYSQQLNCSVEVLTQYDDEELTEFLQRLGQLSSATAHPDFEKMLPFPDKKRCSQGTLTGMGVLQNFVLGSLMSRAYNQFISELEAEHFLSFITQRERTYQSHNAFFTALLMGHAKQKDARKLWSRVVRPADSFVFCDTKYVTNCQCPKLRFHYGDMMSYRQIYFKRDPQCTAVHNSLLKFFETVQLSDSSTEQPGILNLWELRDIIMSGLCSQINLLKDARICWKSNLNEGNADRCLSKEVLQSMWEALDQFHVNLFNQESHRSYAKLAMYPLLAQLVTRMKQPLKPFKDYRNQEETQDSPAKQDYANTDASNEPRLLLYSGHDHTLHYLFGALSLNITEWPPFSSRLVFESFTHTSDSTRKKFRLLYNGRDISRRLSFCKSTAYLPADDSPAGCSVDEFEQYMKKDYWQGFATNDYEKECHHKV